MNTKHNTKFSRKVIGNVVFVLSWLVIFPMVTFAGIINLLTNKVNELDTDAKTPVISDKSKISPKNTTNTRQNRGEIKYSYVDDEVVGI